MSMLRTLADREDPRPHLLLYGAPTEDYLTFSEEIQALPDRIRLQIVQVLASPPPDWSGEPGRIDRAMLGRHLPEDRTAHMYFVCGPPA